MIKENSLKTKQMKKLLYLFLAITVACSSGDDTQNTSDSLSIVGEWKPVRYVYDCTNAEDIIYNFSSCEQQGGFVFNPDGTLFIQRYAFDADGNCYQEEEELWLYEYDADTITFYDSDNNPSQWEYFSLTQSTLKFGSLCTDCGCGEGNDALVYTEMSRQ